MREIKFRAWDNEENKLIPPNMLIGLEGEVTNNLPSHLTLMQFTGLKDKNGKEIYEGDIVKGSFGSVNYQVIIQYVLGCIDGFDPSYEYGYDYRKGEVIGNIYENPELLK